MRRARRRQEAQELVQRAKVLHPDQLGPVMIVLFGQALVSVSLEIALVATAARAARHALRLRGSGIRTIAQTALPRPVIALACVYGGYRICSRPLVLRWVRRVVKRAEDSPARDEEQRPTP